MKNGRLPLVAIVTWCKTPDQLYGNALVFESVRIGFPTARILVIDNASSPELQERLSVCASQVGAEFAPVPEEKAHWEILEEIAFRRPLDALETNRVCFVDPDVIFWSEVEGFDFGAHLLAGRLIPAFEDKTRGFVTMPRLHPSFLWLPDVNALRERMGPSSFPWLDFSPFRPVTFPVGKTILASDTGAALYQILGDRAYAFSEDHLNSYDHLFFGTHAKLVLEHLAEDDAAMFAPFYSLHSKVQRGDRGIKGAWRMQEKHFQSGPLRNPHLGALIYQGPR